MTLEHEYALLGGYNRTHVGRWLGSVAALLSGAVVFLLLSAVDVAAAWGVNVNLPPTILSLVGAGAVYGALYWFFDRHAWKYRPMGTFLKVPNLSGQWECEGTPLESGDAEPWTGTATIVQSWDRLRIHLRTAKSISNSIAAALQHDAAAGYRLMYHYRNEPLPNERDLAPHHGFAEITFTQDLKEASGDYFNGRGRNTFGTMILKRKDS